MEKFLIILEGELIEVKREYDNLFSNINRNKQWYIFSSQKEAGEQARVYWRDMAENDQGEFICIIGKEALLNWALGNYAGPGTSQVRSLDEWLDLWLDVPEEHFASYDGVEIEGVQMNNQLLNEIGGADKDYVVVYRVN